MALPEISLYNKAEIPFLCLHLKYRGIVIAEMIVGPLPQVSMRFCDNLYHSLINGTAFRFSCPFEFAEIYFHFYPPLFSVRSLRRFYCLHILTLFVSEFYNPIVTFCLHKS